MLRYQSPIDTDLKSDDTEPRLSRPRLFQAGLLHVGRFGIVVFVAWKLKGIVLDRQA
jgi:hypothetical protein